MGHWNTPGVSPVDEGGGLHSELVSLLASLYGGDVQEVDPAGGAACTAAVATAGSARTYDVEDDKALSVWVSEDGGETFVELAIADVGSEAADPSAATAAEIAEAINAHAMASRYVVAADWIGSLQLTTVGMGEVAVYVSGDANTPLGFTQDSANNAAVGTGTRAGLTIKVVDAAGQPAADRLIEVRAYDASTEGNVVETVTLLQGSKGSLVGAAGYNCTFRTDQNGMVQCYLADSASAGDLYVQVVAPATNWIAAVLAYDRVMVTTENTE